VDNQAEDLKVTVHRSIQRDNDGNFQGGLVFFKSTFTTPSPEGSPTVNLSRRGDNPECNFTVTNLQEHRMHSPKWSNEEAMEEYIERVLGDVREIVEIGEV